jgi:hypothetical protein
MRKHDALGTSGAAGRIEDGEHVRVDHAMAVTHGHGRQVPERVDRLTIGRAKLRRVLDANDVAQIGTFGRDFVEQAEPLQRADEDSDVAVAEDVADLLGL